jgi:hypothetical protein
MNTKRKPLARRAVLTALLGSAMVAFAWSGTLSNPETMLARSYEAALAHGDAGLSRVTPAALGEAYEQRPVNAIWTGGSLGHHAALYRPLSIGERITFSGAGKPDKLTVVSIEQIDGAVLGSPGVRFQLVTSKIEGPGEAGLVRFLVAVDKPAPRPPDKTL